MNKFSVLKIPSKLPFGVYTDLWEFDTAKDVASFMWGRYMGQYAIYKNGELAHLAHLYPDVTSLEKYLEGDINFPNMSNK